MAVAGRPGRRRVDRHRAGGDCRPSSCDLLRSHLPGVRFHTDMGGMLAGYPELVPVRRPRSALFSRAARSWWSRVTRPRLPGARRFAVWAAAAVLLTAVLCALPAGSAVVAGQLAAALLVLAVVVMLCESPTQLVTVLITGASPPLLLTPRRPVLRLFRPASVLLTAGAAASVLTGQPFPATDVAVSVAVWAVVLTVERFMLGLAPSTSPVRIVGFARGAHPGDGRRRDWAPERRTASGRLRGRRGIVPVLITPPPPPSPTAGA